MAEYNTRIIVPFEGRIHYHEGLIVRSAIALKILYDTKVNIVIATNTPEFVNSLHEPLSIRYPIMIMTMDNLIKFNISGYTVVVNNGNHPFLKTKYGASCSKFILPNINHMVPLEFSSLFFDSEFKYPDLKKMEDIIPPDIRIMDKISMVMR